MRFDIVRGEVAGKAEEAAALPVDVRRLARGAAGALAGGVHAGAAGCGDVSDFRLDDTWSAMGSAQPHGFGFNGAISFTVHCRDQAELDRHGAQRSSVPQAEQCGGCKDAADGPGR